MNLSLKVRLDDAIFLRCLIICFYSFCLDILSLLLLSTMFFCLLLYVQYQKFHFLSFCRLDSDARLFIAYFMLLPLLLQLFLVTMLPCTNFTLFWFISFWIHLCWYYSGQYSPRSFSWVTLCWFCQLFLQQ
jgi:hypothetical protein